jgi:polysaccharide biosynthesis/export protein ExoF
MPDKSKQKRPSPQEAGLGKTAGIQENGTMRSSCVNGANQLRCRSLRVIAPLLLAGSLWLPALAPQASAQADQSYLLGPRDMLNIRVGQWNALEGEYIAWPDVSGEYRVSPEGTIAVPLAGEVVASGLSTGELATEVAMRLGERVGQRDQIEATVDIAEFRPIFVVGGVRSPGAYPFTPGLTVLQALGLAGGIERADPTFLRSERGALTSLGSYEVMRLQLLRRLATAARLQAELDENDSIEIPPELADAPFGSELIDREREIRAARDTTLQSSLSQIDSLESLLNQQIERLSEQLTLRGRQLELAQQELESTASLVERGLSVAANRSALERLVADQQVRSLELETARLNAEQRLNEAGRERLDIINERRREIVEAIRLERSEIEELRVRIRTEAALYAEATRFEDGFISPQGLGAPVMELTRVEDESFITMAAERMDLLRPGDVLEVRLPMLDESLLATRRGPGTGTGPAALPETLPGMPTDEQAAVTQPLMSLPD